MPDICPSVLKYFLTYFINFLKTFNFILTLPGSKPQNNDHFFGPCKLKLGEISFAEFKQS